MLPRSHQKTTELARMWQKSKLKRIITHAIRGSFTASFIKTPSNSWWLIMEQEEGELHDWALAMFQRATLQGQTGIYLRLCTELHTLRKEGFSVVHVLCVRLDAHELIPKPKHASYYHFGLTCSQVKNMTHHRPTDYSSSRLNPQVDSTICCYFTSTAIPGRPSPRTFGFQSVCWQTSKAKQVAINLDRTPARRTGERKTSNGCHFVFFTGN